MGLLFWSSVAAAAVILFAVVAFMVLWRVVKALLAKLLILFLNSLAGLILLFTLNLVFNVGVPVNVFTVVIAGVFGLPGVASLLILRIGGMI
jgi:inhibitor of the pro-sigma K processing machinery